MTRADHIIIADDVVTLTDDAGRRGSLTHIALVGDRILGVGGAELLERHRDADTTVTRYVGATVVPGLTDGHMHPVWGLALAKGVDLTDVSPASAVLDLLREEALTDAEWVLGWGLDPNVFGQLDSDGRRFDQITRGKPMFLRMRDVHSGVANSVALDIAEVTGRETFADKSVVDVDAAGSPTGYLKEMSAMGLVLRKLPPDTVDAHARQLLDLLTRMSAAGLTGAHVMDFGEGSAEILARAEELSDLPLRLRFAPIVPPGADESVLAQVLALQGVGGRRWRVDGVKFMVDGTVDNGTAWLEQPDIYGENVRSMWTEPDQYIHSVRYFANRAIPTATHAIGDRAVRFVLEALSTVEPAIRARAPHRIEHIETIPDETVQQFANLGVIASMQPVHATHHTLADGSDNWSVRLGDERRAHGWRCRDLREHGVPLVLGSDWPVTPFDPKAMMADSILRRPVERPHIAPVQPEQALTPLMALEGYTTQAALAENADGVAGRIAPGYRADLTILSVNPLDSTPEQLATATVHATFLEGCPQHIVPTRPAEDTVSSRVGSDAARPMTNG